MVPKLHYMRIIVVFVCFILTVFSCTKQNQCLSSFELTAPEGYRIQPLSSFDGVGSLEQVQFVSNLIGFITVHKDSIATEVIKTTDGGMSWESLGVILGGYVNDTFFWDEQTGIITTYSNFTYPVLLKTEDGGSNWGEQSFPELVGNITDLFTDEQGNIYGRTSEFDVPGHIIRSTDRGESWETIYVLPSWRGKILGVEYGRIYIEQPEHEIFVLDLEGNKVDHLQVEHLNNLIVDFKVIDQDNIIATSYRDAIKTSDGGQSWELLFEDDVRMIDFTTPEEGIMVLLKRACPDDPVFPGVIAHTTNGGQSWAESGYIRDLVDALSIIEPITESRYALLLKTSPDNYDLYELSAE